MTALKSEGIQTRPLTFISYICIDDTNPSWTLTRLEKKLRFGGVMSERTFIRSMLASIFSCSTSFLACAMLAVLLLAMAALTQASSAPPAGRRFRPERRQSRTSDCVCLTSHTLGLYWWRLLLGNRCRRGGSGGRRRTLWSSSPLKSDSGFLVTKVFFWEI